MLVLGGLTSSAQAASTSSGTLAYPFTGCAPGTVASFTGSKEPSNASVYRPAGNSTNFSLVSSFYLTIGQSSIAPKANGAGEEFVNNARPTERC
jgi:hypothetical protein